MPAAGLWSHQAAALKLIRAGRSTVVSTPTASGKSLIHQIAIAEAACAPLRSGTSLLLYPTKALAQDQLRSFCELGVERIVVATYDGDSSTADKERARDEANVVLTNPEMIHHGLLPNHRRWASFLGRLRYVVVDELHAFRGVFGAHVAHVLRRLTRLANRYGADPTFVLCSATLGDPARHASELCGREVRAITEDGSPRGTRHLVAWDPTAALGAAGSTRSETVEMAASLIDAGARTLVFCRSRHGTEVVAERLRARVDPARASRVRAYRSGYLAEERRAIESDLLAGSLDAVVTTSALELGVDISGVDAVVMSGFPGTVAAMWQQIGRAGRAGAPSVAVLVAGDDQLDRWVMDHPHDTFIRPPERAVTNPANPRVSDAQIACAAHELPLAPGDDRYWGAALDDAVLRGVTAGWLTLRRRGSRHVRAVWSGDGWPASTVGLRSSSRGEHRIVDPDGELVGTIDDGRMSEQAHPGAVYLHQGRAWRVVGTDTSRREVLVVPDPGDTTTQIRAVTEVSLLQTDASRDVGRSRVAVGWVEVTQRITGYQERAVRDHRLVAEVELGLPPTQLVTRAVRYEFDHAVLNAAGIAPEAVHAALHAIEHAAISILPLFAICDRRDVGGISAEHLGDTHTPTIVIYDAFAGGAGIAEMAWEAAERHLAAALGVIERCGCRDGCPSCVQSPRCSGWNDRLDKACAARLLRTVLHR